MNNVPYIDVSGEAVVNVKPDKVVITLGIETSDKNIQAAKKKNNDILSRLVAALKKNGVTEKDIQTDYLSIDPRWEHYSKKEEFQGYFVRNSVSVTVADAARVEEVISGAIDAGVNYIHKVDFQTSEFKKYREQARELALRAAREKAEKMAAVLGQSLGAVLKIVENHDGSSWWYGGWWGWGSRGGGMSQVNIQEDRGSGSEITGNVALGAIGIKANVSVAFELKK